MLLSDTSFLNVYFNDCSQKNAYSGRSFISQLPLQLRSALSPSFVSSEPLFSSFISWQKCETAQTWSLWSCWSSQWIACVPLNSTFKKVSRWNVTYESKLHIALETLSSGCLVAYEQALHGLNILICLGMECLQEPRVNKGRKRDSGEAMLHTTTPNLL